jgi:long-chain fatty acid transport protein
MRMRGLFAAVLLLILTTMTWASGTLIYEQSSKASAQANAMVARANDSTAVFYNPAGLAFTKGMDFQFNLTYINADVKYESPTLGTHKDNAKNFFLPAIYFSMPVNDRIVLGVMSSAPFNLATDWSDNFPGRFASRHAKIVTMDLRPVISFKLDDHNAIAVGLDYYDSTLNLIRNVNSSALSTAINPHQLPSPPFPPGIPFYQASEVSLDAHLRDQALGWNVSYMYNAKPWSFGLFYRSKAKLDYTGHASFEVDPHLAPVSGLFPGQGLDVSIESVPAVGTIGFAYSGSPLEVEFDYQWTQWSTWGRSMAHFEQPTSFHGSHIVADEEFIFDWKNTSTYRLGFSYKLSDNYDIRWGVLYDEAPVPDQTLSPTLPDKDRWSIQFGTGYHKGNWNVDWYAMYLKFKEANITSSNIYRYGETGLPLVVVPVYGQLYPLSYPITPDGSYKGTAWLFGLQFGYKF